MSCVKGMSWVTGTLEKANSNFDQSTAALTWWCGPRPCFGLGRNGCWTSHSRFPPRNLCSLVTLAVFSLVYSATDTAFCYVLISLGLAESRILPAAPVDIRPRTPLISFFTVQLRTLCVAHFWRLSVSLRPLVQTLGNCAASGVPWFSAMPPFLGRGRVNTTNNNNPNEVGDRTTTLRRLLINAETSCSPKLIVFYNNGMKIRCWDTLRKYFLSNLMDY